MKKIGLTQRVEVVTEYNERRDCLDQNWVVLLQKLGFAPVILPNMIATDAVHDYLDSLSLDGVLLTGGNDLVWTQSEQAAAERDHFETKLIEYSLDRNLPILGVCRGMQMLNLYFGGQLQQTSQHVTNSHQVILHDGHSYDVNSYHNWGIPEVTLASAFEALGHSTDGLVEYCRHKSKSITGMMWHPERTNHDSQIGLNIIKQAFK